MCGKNDAAAKMSVPVADKGEPAPPVDKALLADLVTANHILYRHRVVDAFGHVSIRHDKDPERFLLARNLAPGQVTADDIVEFDLDGAPVNAAGRPVYLERFIHGEIYRARPDVMAVVHSHAPEVVPFAVVPTQPLRPLWHMSGFLGEGAPVFEIRETAGEDSDLLIRNNELGKALARSIGDGSVVLMRGHGATIAASSLRLTVFQAVYTQMNAELQMKAMGLGPVIYLTEGEARTTWESVGGQADRAWNLWKSEAEG
ncbi:MAG: class II aldolase/adducin family protein [Alphaproteobacteria bacterium]|nr:class II aldolase/adducin family protein [Alphaproteobacteria bacterium]